LKRKRKQAGPKGKWLVSFLDVCLLAQHFAELGLETLEDRVPSQRRKRRSFAVNTAVSLTPQEKAFNKLGNVLVSHACSRSVVGVRAAIFGSLCQLLCVDKFRLSPILAAYDEEDEPKFLRHVGFYFGEVVALPPKIAHPKYISGLQIDFESYD
jgi:hypothetical protein